MTSPCPNPRRLGEKPPLLLPLPKPAEVADFVDLYGETYGVKIDDQKAYEILGGLMRWRWLTRERPAGDGDGQGDPGGNDCPPAA